MRTTYLWLARLIALAVVAQAAFVAYGTFEIFNAAEDGRAFTEDTSYNIGQELHAAFGVTLIPLLTLVLLIVSFFARVPGGVRLAGILFGLVVLQVVFAFIAFPAPVLGLLHGVNAFALAAVAGFAGRPVRAPGPASTASTEAPASA